MLVTRCRGGTLLGARPRQAARGAGRDLRGARPARPGADAPLPLPRARHAGGAGRVRSRRAAGPQHRRGRPGDRRPLRGRGAPPGAGRAVRAARRRRRPRRTCGGCSRSGRDTGAPRPHGALLFSCTGRGSGLFGRPDHDTGLFEEVLGPAALGGLLLQRGDRAGGRDHLPARLHQRLRPLPRREAPRISRQPARPDAAFPRRVLDERAVAGVLRGQRREELLDSGSALRASCSAWTEPKRRSMLGDAPEDGARVGRRRRFSAERRASSTRSRRPCPSRIGAIPGPVISWGQGVFPWWRSSSRMRMACCPSSAASCAKSSRR